MQKVKNLEYFTAITFFILSILFTVTSSAVSINFNPDSSKNVISHFESFSSIINGNILSIAYAQDDGSDEEEEVEEEKEEEVEEEKEEEVEEGEDTPPPSEDTPPPAPVLAQQSDLLVYENPELGFKIQYPSNWAKAGNDIGSIPVMFTLTESEDGITTLPQLGPATDKKIKANILVNVQPAGSSSLQQTGNAETQQIKASLEQFSLKKINELINSKNTKFNILESNSAATLGVKNMSAYKLVYNGTQIVDNSKVKGFDIFTIQGDKAYSILYLAKESNINKEVN